MTSGGGTLRMMMRGTGDALSRLHFTLRRAARGFRLNVPERLLIAPQELVSGDPTSAMDMYSGQIVLAGRTAMSRGQSPFSIQAPSYAWLRELHSFGWLRNFRDADNPVVRQHARALVAEWMAMREAHRNPSARLPEVAALRMLSWLTNSPLLLTDTDHAFYHRFLRSLARNAQRLEHAAGRPRLGIGRLYAAMAYACYTLCAHTGENDWKKASRLLGQALAESILPDGCPVSRNPRHALEIGAILLPLRTAYTSRGRTPPPELQTTLDRLMAFLRLMRHGSGELAQFNGMNATRLDQIGAILQFDDARATPPASARVGGYHRLERGGTMLIIDTGCAPPAVNAATTHAGALSFELSAGHERIVINCGSPEAGLDELREALRETAAHSTLSIGEASSARFRLWRARDRAPERLLVDVAPAPSVERDNAGDEDRIALGHGGYLRSHGVSHERLCQISHNGAVVSGVDVLRADGRRRKTAFAGATLRFHLHPRVRPALSEDGASVELVLGDGTLWLFEAGGAPITLEDSIFLGGLASQRRTQQMVIALGAPDAEVRWSFQTLSDLPALPLRGMQGG